MFESLECQSGHANKTVAAYMLVESFSESLTHNPLASATILVALVEVFPIFDKIKTLIKTFIRKYN